MTIDERVAVGDLAAAVPGSVRVFERYGVDFCCGGRKTLADACDEAGLSVTDVAREIEEVAADEGPERRDWRTEPLGRVLDHIVATYHDPLRVELPQLQALMSKVVVAHGAKRPALLRAQEIVDELAPDLIAHMRKEEAVLFPAIRRAESGQPAGLPLQGSIAVMEAEHDRAGLLLHKLRVLTDGYIPPTWACASLRALYAQLERLESAMHVHVHLENNVVFPRAATLLALSHPLGRD